MISGKYSCTVSVYDLLSERYKCEVDDERENAEAW